MNKTTKFVLQLHKSLGRAGTHFDLRIQPPGKKNILYSWALPKAMVPKNIGDKCLAVIGNVHSKMYLYVDHMTIPEGYGRGTIDTIQKGNLEIEAWSNKYITFSCHDPSSEYLNGRYAIIKFDGHQTKDENNLWVLIKIKEKESN